MRTSLESIQVHLSIKKIKSFFIRKFFKNWPSCPPIFPIFRFEARYRSSKMSSLTSIHMYFRELSLSLSFSLLSLCLSLSFSEIQRYQYNVGFCASLLILIDCSFCLYVYSICFLRTLTCCLTLLTYYIDIDTIDKIDMYFFACFCLWHSDCRCKAFNILFFFPFVARILDNIYSICTIFRARTVAKTISQAWYLDFFLQGDSRYVVYIVDLYGIEYSFMFLAPGQFFSVSYLTDERSYHLKLCCYIIYSVYSFIFSWKESWKSNLHFVMGIDIFRLYQYSMTENNVLVTF